MARGSEKLSAIGILRLKKPGLYNDGHGLYLRVGDTAALPDSKPKDGKSWIKRYAIAGKTHDLGLGPLSLVSLVEARKRNAAIGLQLLDGIDPLAVKHAARHAVAVELAKAVTFRQCAAQYIELNRAGWSNAKHASQWVNTLDQYAHPIIGHLPVAAVDAGHVTKILEPIWSEKTTTASRLRGRIETVLDYAKSRGWREGENPARWKGHLANILPARARVAETEHHAALDWREIATFMGNLEALDGLAPLALRLTILVALRTSEVLSAKWPEIDFAAGVWNVPAARMKAKRPHRVPLVEAVLTILRALVPLRDEAAGDWLFPDAGRPGKPVEVRTMLRLVRKMGEVEATVHGMRSVFRDWAAETGKAEDIAEAAIAHKLASKVQAAYQRGDLLQRRRILMEQWATFCATPPGANVLDWQRRDTLV